MTDRRHVMVSSHQFSGCGYWHIFAADGQPVVEWHSGVVEKLPPYYSIKFTDECWDRSKQQAAPEKECE